MGKIGITTTIPQEIIWASGNVPVDMNNIFIRSDNRDLLLKTALDAGFPRTSCPWISGIFGAMRTVEEIDMLIVVLQGDCSNTRALSEVLESFGVKVIPFSFPYEEDLKGLHDEMLSLAEKLGAKWENVLEWFEKLKATRKLAHKLDEMTWRDNLIYGKENHLFLVSTSDFNGDIEKYHREIEKLIAKARTRKPLEEKVRLGYIGVPPIFPDIFEGCEKMGARFVFCEIQRQFALPFFESDIITAYSKYTYPKSAFARIKDIEKEIKRRKINGIVHYVQSFCFRGIEDILFRKFLPVPILTIEGENSSELDERTKLRLEAFVRMIERST